MSLFDFRIEEKGYQDFLQILVVIDQPSARSIFQVTLFCKRESILDNAFFINGSPLLAGIIFQITLFCKREFTRSKWESMQKEKEI